jgi:hypothetical protein
MGRRTYNQKNQQQEERPTVKRRQFNSTEMRGVKAQLRKWCNARNQLALRITGQFFDLMFPGHLVLGPNDEGFVFQSSHNAIVSAIVLRAFAALELKQEDGRVIVSMNRKEGRIAIAEIETLADMLSVIPLPSKLVH